MCGDKFMSDCFHTAGSASLPAHEQPSIGSLCWEKAARCLGFRLIRRTSPCPRFRGVNKVSARSCVVGLVNEQTVGDGTGGGWGWSAGGVAGWVAGFIAGAVFPCLVSRFQNGAVKGWGGWRGCLPESCLQSWRWRCGGGGGGGGVMGGLSVFLSLASRFGNGAVGRGEGMAGGVFPCLVSRVGDGKEAGGGGGNGGVSGAGSPCVLSLELGIARGRGGGETSCVLSLELGMARRRGGGGGDGRGLQVSYL